MEIGINNYKKANQRYIIISEKEKSKEFLKITKYLIFEGEYKNGN